MIKLIKKICQLKFILFLLSFGMFFFFVYLLYNKSAETFAADDTPPSTLLCGKEIPNGEAMDKTGDLLSALTKELSAIDENIYQEIQSAEATMKSSGDCDINVCKPVDCESESYTDTYSCADASNPCAPYDGNGPATCNCPKSRCKSPKPCTSQWDFDSAYRACPQETIEGNFTTVDGYYQKIDASKKEIWALIDGTFGAIPNFPEVDRRESLCPNINRDIRSSAETVACIGYPNIPNPFYPQLTKIGVIARKLDKSRSEFDKCYTPPSDWEKVVKQEISGKVLLNCDTIMSQQLPRETKTTKDVAGKPLPVCTSPHNYFCCH